MSPTTTRTRPTRPSAALRAHGDATVLLNATCPPERAQAALDFLVRSRGYGAVEALTEGTGISRQTVKNYRNGRTAITAATVRRIAAYYACEEPPTDPEQLDAAIEAGVPGVDELFDLFYSDDRKAAFQWLLDHRAANFRWNTDEAA